MHGASSDTVSVNIAAHLGIAPSEIFLSVKKVVGDKVDQGEVLAQKKTMLSVKKFISPQEGWVREINHEDGSMMIEVAASNAQAMECFFAGVVERFTSSQICIKVSTSKEFPLLSCDASFGGKVSFFSQQEVHELTEQEVARHVVFTPHVTPYEQSKIEALGAAGFVTESALATDEVPPKAVLKLKTDMAKIKSTRLPYCIIDKKSGTLFLYK